MEYPHFHIMAKINVSRFADVFSFKGIMPPLC